jgi:glycosyltransferase involved in cell wall biosynthesis
MKRAIDASQAKPENPIVNSFNILCLSHLAWQTTLFQRPQQIMTQLSMRGHRIVYAGCIGLQALSGIPEHRGQSHPNLRFLNISFSAHAAKFRTLRRISASRLLRKEAYKHFNQDQKTIIFLYHPGLLPLARAVIPDALVVYDVMDRFDAFEHSGRANGTRNEERNAVAQASVLFSGGMSLQTHVESIVQADQLNTPVHCLPSGVDSEHFGSARQVSMAIPADIRELSHPLLGYFGALDERLDYALIGDIARKRPSWTILLIGPLVKPVPPYLPSNVVVAGPKKYEVLPSYLKAFDIAIMPFRRSELVAHISPTKTPEYLAGGKPVVSTKVPDVESHYSGIVDIAEDSEQFLELCESAILNPPAPDFLAEAAALRSMSWADIAVRMEATINHAIEEKS